MGQVCQIQRVLGFDGCTLHVELLLLRFVGLVTEVSSALNVSLAKSSFLSILPYLSTVAVTTLVAPDRRLLGKQGYSFQNRRAKDVANALLWGVCRQRCRLLVSSFPEPRPRL